MIQFYYIWVTRSKRYIVICNVGNQDDDDYQNLEDGRSRRYFMRTALFANMFSVPIEESFMPITSSKHSCTTNTGNFRVMQMRHMPKGAEGVEIIVCYVVVKITQITQL